MVAPRPATVLFHPDPRRLEAELAVLVTAWRRASDPDDPFQPILVVAPSRRLVLRLREILARRLPALLGVEVLTHQGLSYRLGGLGPEVPTARLLSRPLLDSLVREVLTQNADWDLSSYAADRPGPTHALGSLLRELREAGISGADLAGVSPDLAPLLRSYETALAALDTADGAGGDTDRAGLTARAAKTAAGLPPVRGVISYGAYELVGMNLDLLRAIPSREDLVFLVPGDPGAPAWTYATTYSRRHLGAQLRRLEDLDPLPPFVEAAIRVHDPEARGEGSLLPGQISLVHAQGSEAELTFVARDILCRVRKDGVAPGEIGVVARTLEPYAPLAETVFARHGLPVDSSLRLPLLRHPQAQAFGLLVRLLEDDLPRPAVIELARDPAFAPPRHEEGRPPWNPHRWDAWSRRYGVTRGLESWRELPERLRNVSRGPWNQEEEESEKEFRTRCEANAASATELIRWLEEVAATWIAAARSPRAADHAEALRTLAATWIDGGQDPGRGRNREVSDALESVLLDLERLDDVRSAVPGGVARGPADAAAASLSFVRQALGEVRLPWRDPGGLRFLDVMQARGLVFRHLYLIGFQTEMFPLGRREDPFLPDALRRKLRDATGHPLAVQEEGTEEERLLLATTVAAAEESLTVTWQRADATGRERTVSLWLRELARGMRDTPALRPLLNKKAEVKPARVPTHPAEAARWHAEKSRLLSLEEAGLAASHFARGEGTGALRAFLREVDAGREERLRPGFALVSAIELPETEDLPYDGLLPAPVDLPHRLSATSLGMLARCPLQFFFRYVLRVHPLDEAAREDRMHPRDLGIHVHRVLENVYRRLDREFLLGPEADPERLGTAGRVALDAEWERWVAPFGGRLGERFPILLDHALEVWRGELERFLDKDLARMAAEGHTLLGLEEAWRGDMELAGEYAESIPLALQGFPDRVTRSRDGTWVVTDYKTSGKLRQQVDLKENLSARKPQLPLYLLLARNRGANPVRAEVLGLGPDLEEEYRFVGGDAIRHEEKDLEVLDGEGFSETLAILGGLPLRGLYPFRAGRHCSWCEYRLACRKSHHASGRRVAEHAAFATYFLTQKKTKTKPRVADVRAKAGRRS